MAHEPIHSKWVTDKECRWEWHKHENDWQKVRAVNDWGFYDRTISCACDVGRHRHCPYAATWNVCARDTRRLIDDHSIWMISLRLSLVRLMRARTVISSEWLDGTSNECIAHHAGATNITLYDNQLHFIKRSRSSDDEHIKCNNRLAADGSLRLPSELRVSIDGMKRFFSRCCCLHSVRVSYRSTCSPPNDRIATSCKWSSIYTINKWSLFCGRDECEPIKPDPNNVRSISWPKSISHRDSLEIYCCQTQTKTHRSIGAVSDQNVAVRRMFKGIPRTAHITSPFAVAVCRCSVVLSASKVVFLFFSIRLMFVAVWVFGAAICDHFLFPNRKQVFRLAGPSKLKVIVSICQRHANADTFQWVCNSSSRQSWAHGHSNEPRLSGVTLFSLGIEPNEYCMRARAFDRTSYLFSNKWNFSARNNFRPLDWVSTRVCRAIFNLKHRKKVEASNSIGATAVRSTRIDHCHRCAHFSHFFPGKIVWDVEMLYGHLCEAIEWLWQILATPPCSSTSDDMCNWDLGARAHTLVFKYSYILFDANLGECTYARPFCGCFTFRCQEMCISFAYRNWAPLFSSLHANNNKINNPKWIYDICLLCQPADPAVGRFWAFVNRRVRERQLFAANIFIFASMGLGMPCVHRLITIRCVRALID